MADEKSAVAAWLNLPSTKKEIAVARRKLAQHGSTADPVLFVLGIEILAALEVYEIATLDQVIDLDPPPPLPGDEWKHGKAPE